MVDTGNWLQEAGAEPIPPSSPPTDGPEQLPPRSRVCGSLPARSVLQEHAQPTSREPEVMERQHQEQHTCPSGTVHRLCLHSPERAPCCICPEQHFRPCFTSAPPPPQASWNEPLAFKSLLGDAPLTQPCMPQGHHTRGHSAWIYRLSPNTPPGCSMCCSRLERPVCTQPSVWKPPPRAQGLSVAVASAQASS